MAGQGIVVLYICTVFKVKVMQLTVGGMSSMCEVKIRTIVRR